MPRPKIKIKPTVIDILVEIIGVFALSILVGLPIYYYSQLPETIPTHFGLDGTANAWGHRDTIWILPSIGLVLFALLWILNKYPHVFNYLKPITEENAQRQYFLATRMMRILNSSVVVLMAYLIYGQIQVALENQVGHLNTLWPFFVIIFAILGTYIYFAIKED
mgnify:CR=1 FL=1